ncbi:hypothetical protein AB1K70_20815 [Bremerella sp. JC770]|uniref:hypothetical protein n=1 Tax=Bremerella sp. JC770 TaxID=3232137 RepID=UPI003457608D
MTWTAIGGLVCLFFLVLLVLAIVGIIYLFKLSEKEFQQRMQENGKPVLAVVIMANSQFLRDHSIPHAPALLLISFDDPSPELADDMRDVASELFSLYTADAEDIAGRSDAEQQMAACVKDDGYRPKRRRLVAAEMSRGWKLYMADEVLNRVDIPDHTLVTRVIACKATGEEKGEIMVLPPQNDEAQEVYRALGLG